MRAYGRQIDHGFKIGAPGSSLDPSESPKPGPPGSALRQRHRSGELGVNANEIGIGVVWLVFYSLIFALVVISATP
jgi:hypothetical protein